MAEVGSGGERRSGDVDAELEREDEYVFLPLLLPCVCSRACHVRGRQRRLIEECPGGVCLFLAWWSRANEGDTGGGGRGSHARRVVARTKRRLIFP